MKEKAQISIEYLLKKGTMMKEKAQISIEYLLIIGFVTFAIASILGLAFFYSGSIREKIKMTQVNNFANKIISTADSIYYAGVPSKATINGYLPEGVKDIGINEAEKSLIIDIQTQSGLNKIAFSSSVPILEDLNALLTTSQGLKKIKIEAQLVGTENKVVIGQA